MELNQLKRILRQLLWTPVAALLLLSAVLVWQIQVAVRTVEQTQLADRNIALAARLNAAITDEESGVRGFQITGNQIFLQPYQFSQKPIARGFLRLRENIAAEGEDPAPVDRLVDAHGDWQRAIALPMIEATRKGKDTRDAGMNLRGKGRMDAMRVAIRAIINEQQRRRDLSVEHFEHVVRQTVEGTLGLALVIGLMIGVFSRSQLHAVSVAFRRAAEALQRNAEEAQDSEERLRTILGSIGDGVVVTDVAGSVEMMNPVAQGLTDMSVAEAMHRPAEAVIHLLQDPGREELPTPAMMALAERKRVALASNAVMRRRDGTEFAVDASAAPIVDSHGELTGAVMVLRDVTEAKHTQAALLASEKLAVAGRLAATIAHEIHNPLDAVINLLYLLQNHPTEEEREQFLQMAASELDRVAQISRAMLGMYRESKTPIDVDVTEMMVSLLLLLERHLAQARISVATHFDPGTVIRGYPAELRQVFTNLMTNAIEASSVGGVLRVSVELQGKPKGGVVVTIADSGTGVPEDVLPRLFQPFFTTKGELGTGLGLWVSQGIVQKHGGTIELTTRTAGPEHGTELTVWLPGV